MSSSGSGHGRSAPKSHASPLVTSDVAPSLRSGALMPDMQLAEEQAEADDDERSAFLAIHVNQTSGGGRHADTPDTAGLQSVTYASDPEGSPASGIGSNSWRPGGSRVVARRISPSNSPKPSARSPTASPSADSPRTSSFSSASRVPSPINYHVAQWVVLSFIALGAVYFLWEMTHPFDVRRVATTKMDDIPRLTATIPVPRVGPRIEWWPERIASIRRDVAARGGSTRLLLVGDSITQGWGEQGRVALDSHFARWDPLNLGVSGDQTQHVLWRLLGGGDDSSTTPTPASFTPAHLDAVRASGSSVGGAGELAGVGQQCRLIVLMLGTNNSRWGCRAKDTLWGLRKIIALLQSHFGLGAHIIVFTVFPRADWIQPFALNQQLNALMRGEGAEKAWADAAASTPPASTDAAPADSTATGSTLSSALEATSSMGSALAHAPSGVFVYDMSSSFVASGMPLPSSPSVAMPVLAPGLYVNDSLHLSAQGYERWAQALLPLLEKHEALQAKEAADAAATATRDAEIQT